MYEGPAGVVLSKADAELIHTSLLHNNTPEAIDLRRRITDWMCSTWEDVAQKREKAMRGCTPVKNS